MSDVEIIRRLNEGFNLYRNANGRFFVEMTDEHENGLDTSVVANPCYSTISIKMNDTGRYITVPVVSMFTRKASLDSRSDGNPVLYALKNERNYRFKSYKKDISFIEKRFKEILSLQFSKSGNNTTVIIPTIKHIQIPEIGVVVPSSSKINEMIVRLIKETYPNISIIDNIITKLKTEVVYDDCVNNYDSNFYKYLRDKNSSETDIENAIIELNSYLDEMDKSNNGVFTKHFVKNKEMRRSIIRTLQLSSDNKRYYKDINNRDILLIDDSMTYGQTISECINLLNSEYSPKSIIVLTMFSQKQLY